MSTSLDKLYAKLEDVRKKKVKLALTFYVLGGIVLLIAIILLFVSVANDMGMLTYVGVVMGILSIPFLGAGFGTQSSFTKYVRINCEAAICVNLFPDAKRDPNAGFSLNELLYPGFFATPDRYSSSELMTATYKGIPFEKSAYQLEKKHTTTDSKGNTTTTYIPYASGTLYRFHFEKDFKAIVKVIEKSGAISFGSYSRGLEAVETEFIEFNRKFKTLTDDKQTVFYLLTPQIQEKIMGLERRYKGHFYMAYMGNTLYIAVNDSGQTVNVSFWKEVNEANMARVLEFYGAPAVFIDSLGLDSYKFKNQDKIV